MEKKLTVKNIRMTNQINVLSAIAEARGITRSELAISNDVSLMTITNVVEDLLALKSVYEVKCEASIGRTPSKLHFNDNSGVILSIDLTSKSCSDIIFFDIHKEVIHKEILQFDKNISYKDNMLMLLQTLSTIITRLKVSIIGIGISVPGVYIEETDSVKTSLIPEHQNSNLYKIFSKFFNNKNIVIAHDVNMAGYAESLKIPKSASLFLVKISEGVGGSFVKEGKIVKGRDLFAGDVGQTLIGDPLFAVPLERLAAVSSIERYVQSLGCDQKIDEILSKYLVGEEVYSKHLDYVFGVLSMALYNIMWQYNPDYIFVDSSSKLFSEIAVKKANSFYYAKKSLEEYSALQHINTVMSVSLLEENAALVGLFYKVKERHIESIIFNK